MSKIEFSIVDTYIDSVPHPCPAKKMVPKWYKSMSQFIKDDIKFSSFFDYKKMNQEMNLTMKACIPIRDSLTSGYIIPFAFDLRASRGTIKTEEFEVENKLSFHWNNNIRPNVIDFHPVDQIKGSPLEKDSKDDGGVHKFNSLWRIKTDPGYSCMFYTPPYHNLPFEILPGIVDTDGMHEINFPFIWKSKEKEILLKQGLPMVLVFPFKREHFKHTVKSHTQKEEMNSQQHMFNVLAHWYRDVAHKKKRFD